jgi:hypothetical protein
MKILMKIAVMVTGLVLTICSVSYAVTPLSLNGNSYAIVAFCTNDAGDYCSQGDIKNDAFRFEDDEFIVDSFDGGVLGVGGSGEFQEMGIYFTASYEVISEELVEKYTFDVIGFNFIDFIIIGQMNISYYELGIGGYDKQDEAKAFFFGSKKTDN